MDNEFRSKLLKIWDTLTDEEKYDALTITEDTTELNTIKKYNDFYIQESFISLKR